MPQPHGHGHRAWVQRLRGPGGQLDAPVRRGQLDHVSAAESELVRRLDGHLDPAVPRDLGHDIGSFLEPRLVRRAAIVEARGRVQEEGMRAVALELGRLSRESPDVRLAHRRRGGRTPHATAPERLLPEIGEGLPAAVLAREPSPLLADILLEASPLERALALFGAERPPPEREQDIARRLAVHGLAVHGHRPHGRLHEADDAIARGVVAPRLERVEGGKDHGGLGRGLRRMAGQTDHEADLGEGLAEAGLGGHVVHGVDVGEDEDVDLAGGHGLRQLGHVGIRAGLAQRGVGSEADGLAHGAHGAVQEIDGDEGVGGLRPRHGHAPADGEGTVGLREIVGDALDGLRGNARDLRRLGDIHALDGGAQRARVGFLGVPSLL